MKKLLITFLTLLLSLSLIPFGTVHADTGFYQDHYPYTTYTVDYQGHLTYTQTAYTPLGVLNEPDLLNAPSDLFLKNGLIYVADSGNARIAVLDYEGTLVQEIGLGLLADPTGVFVSAEDFVYVADKTNQLVYKFQTDGTFVRTYGKPLEPLFGSASLYIPVKVVVGAGENIYVIGDGATSGVIQLNYDGSFLGYFGVNLSSKSLLRKIADVFVQTGEYAGSTPPSPTNIAINDKSLVYTSTPNTESALKKLDVNGNNVLTTANYNPTANVVDLSVDDLGYLFAIYDDGLIVEYDPQGNLLFAFDVVSSTSNVLGLLRSPTSIASDENGILFCLDSAGNSVVAFAPTDFAILVHQAIEMYNQGEYLQSTALFEAILKQNANFALAHSALGKAYFQNGLYGQALEEYRLASDRLGYSETYWKIRDLWLKENLSWVFLLLIGLMVVSAILKIVDKRTPAFAGIHERVKTLQANKEVRKYTLLWQMLKHPADGYFQIKRLHRASYGSATVILAVLFLEYLLMIRYTGFVFNFYPEEINLFGVTATFFGIFFLFVFANYLISTLSDGEGWFKDVYIATTYSLAPFVFGMIPLTILSNVLTMNENVVYGLVSTLMTGWTGLLLFLSVKEIQNYEIKETVKNLLMTLFTVVIIILIGFIVYVFGAELFDFIVAWLKEVVNRVFA